jgi:two-component system NtrC family sensor kinase
MKSSLEAGALAARTERTRSKSASRRPRPPEFPAEARSGAAPGFARVLELLAEPLPEELEPQALVEVVVERLASGLPGLLVGAEIGEADGTRAVALRAQRGELFELSALDALETTERVYVRYLTGCEPSSRLFVASPEHHGRALRSFHRQAVDLAANLLTARLAERRATMRARRLAEELVRVEKLASLGKVVSSVLHELNNPLTSILSYADRLAVRLGARSDSDEHIEALRRIKDSAERVQIFARDLVFYCRPSPEVRVEVVLANLIDKALFLCDHEFSAASVQVVRRDELGSTPLFGVPDQLVRVFVNLFTNAAHAMSERGGTLRVEAAPDLAGEFAVVVVSDDGCGVAAAELSRIFDAFFTTKSEDRGTGLGLAIVRDILDAHGATIDVSSSEGFGTDFVLRLPLSR